MKKPLKLNKAREAAIMRLAEEHWHKEVFTRYDDEGKELANPQMMEILIKMYYLKKTYAPMRDTTIYRINQFRWLDKFYRSRFYQHFKEKSPD